MDQSSPNLLQRLDALVWGAPARPMSRLQAIGLRCLRTLLVLGRDLAMGQLTLRAMSLVYTTLLSIVPMLALSFSVLKAFGVANQLQPLLLRFLEPLGERGVDVAQRILDFVENMNVGVLGALGLGLLLYTAVSLMQKIEESLNFIWHIPQPRRLADRFSRYLSVLLVGPILVFSALGITASLMNLTLVRELMALGALGPVLRLAGALLPYALVILAFAFIYLFIPNTKVGWGAALAGALVGGVAWQTAGWAFAAFVVSSGSYAAIYSGLAILVLFMIWVYLSWLILLFGASVAFYVQHPEYLLSRGGEPRLSNRMRERLALTLMVEVCQRFSAGQTAPSLPELARDLGLPQHVLQVVVGALHDSGLLSANADEPPRWRPGVDPAMVPVAQVLAVVRAAGEEGLLTPAHLAVVPGVDALLQRLQQASQQALAGLSLRDLAQGLAESPTPPTPPAPPVHNDAPGR